MPEQEQTARYSPAEIGPKWHLVGQVAFVASIHAARGARLAQLMEGIGWE